MVQPGPNNTNVGKLTGSILLDHKSLTAMPQWDAEKVEQVLFYERVCRDVYDTAWAECRDDGIFGSPLVFAAFFVLGYVLMDVLCVCVL